MLQHFLTELLNQAKNNPTLTALSLLVLANLVGEALVRKAPVGGRAYHFGQLLLGFVPAALSIWNSVRGMLRLPPVALPPGATALPVSAPTGTPGSGAPTPQGGTPGAGKAAIVALGLLGGLAGLPSEARADGWKQSPVFSFLEVRPAHPQPFAAAPGIGYAYGYDWSRWALEGALLLNGTSPSTRPRRPRRT